jgi:uncharacterized membrane protein
MNKNRTEAFSDGVIAIIVTIMVLELKVPHDSTLSALADLFPVFLSYVLSFLVVGIMWVNHHHLLATVRRVNARLLWANINLLFWMSLIPFVTAYMGENHGAPLPVALYGLVLAVASWSFTPLRRVIAEQHTDRPDLSEHHGRALVKNRFSPGLYLLGAALASVSVWISFALFVSVPVMYFMPERQLEDAVSE